MLNRRRANDRNPAIIRAFLSELRARRAIARRLVMIVKILKATAIALALLAPVGALAQGVVGGAAKGADDGAAAAGPVGAVVVGAVSGGGTGDLLGVDQRPRFREYVARERHPSYRYNDDVRVGAILPPSGIEYYDVPSEYGVAGDRYAIVNDRTVLVDPSTHRIVQIIE
jgi:hypothetical protein